MKKLQNDFTTPEQSKILLELGLPADSADCFYLKVKPVEDYVYVLTDNRTYTEQAAISEFKYTDFLPCWSVGRLIEIFDICDISYISDEWPNTTTMTKRSGSVIEYIVGTYENAHNKKLLDFSKLED